MTVKPVLVHSSAPGPTAASSASGGSGPVDPIEHRLSEAEKAIVRIDGRLDTIGVKLDLIIAQVGNWKWQLLAGVIALIVAVFGTEFTIQQMTVATFQASAAQTQALIPSPVQPQVQPPSTIINMPAAAAKK